MWEKVPGVRPWEVGRGPRLPAWEGAGAGVCSAAPSAKLRSPPGSHQGGARVRVSQESGLRDEHAAPGSPPRPGRPGRRPAVSGLEDEAKGGSRWLGDQVSKARGLG